MTFLQMVKRLVQELGVELPSKVTSVTITPATAYGDTTQFINDCVTWIQQAWVELQEDQQDWDFMRKQGTFDLIKGQTQYEIPLQPNLADYDGIRPFVAVLDRRYIWLVDGSTQPPTKSPCYYVVPEHYWGFFNKPPLPEGPPNRYSFTSNGCILLYPVPSNDSMKLEFRYRRAIHELVGDTDTPTGLPDKFHMAIVYLAMEYYSGFDETQNQWARAVKRKRKMLNKLYIEQLPEYTVTGVR